MVIHSIGPNIFHGHPCLVATLYSLHVLPRKKTPPLKAKILMVPLNFTSLPPISLFPLPFLIGDSSLIRCVYEISPFIISLHIVLRHFSITLLVSFTDKVCKWYSSKQMPCHQTLCSTLNLAPYHSELLSVVLYV